MLRFGVMASGGGSNFQAILDRCADGSLQGECAFLITNNSRCKAVERARAHGIPVHHISGLTHPDPKAYTHAMLEVARQSGARVLALAGYMKKVPTALLDYFEGQVLNVHPALLPAFGGEGLYGERVHEAVLASGVRLSGPTIHFVDPVYDHGRIIAQRAVPVYSDDTVASLSARVLEQEHDLYWRVLQALEEGKIALQNGRVYGDVP